MSQQRHFNDWLQAYCDLLDGKTEAPRRFLFWSAVSCLAGALTRRVVIDEVTYRYFPNFYVLLVSPPGAVKKTTIIDLAISLLRELSAEVAHINLGPDITTTEALCQHIARLNADILSSAGKPTIDSDFDNQCAVTFAVGEFGTLYQSDNKTLVNVLTDLFDGRSTPLMKMTKTQGNDTIYNPFVNLIAGTTPHFLQDEFKTQYGGWGFSSRIIFVFADDKERAIYRPSKHLGGSDYREGRQKLLEDLRHMAFLSGQFRFTPEADSWAEQWYIQTEQATREYVKGDGYNEWVGYFKARKQVHVHKLAMLLSISRRDSLTITIEDLREAAAQVDEVERELPKAFDKRLTPSAGALTEQAIIDRIAGQLAEGPLLRSDVMGSVVRFVDSYMANRMIESALARRIITQEIRRGGVSWLKNGHAGKDSGEDERKLE